MPLFFPIHEIYYSSHFKKAFSKLPRSTQKHAIEAEIFFRKDCFDSRLKTHKLKGKLDGFWSFSIDYSHRILFEFQENKGKRVHGKISFKFKVAFIDVGNHSIYG